MKIKIKKRLHTHIVKMQGEGEIKEILIHTDIINREKGNISICFRGHNSSGIVELTDKEANELYKTLGSKINLIREMKVIR